MTSVDSKLCRGQIMYQYHMANPQMSPRQIGKIFGVSPQRANFVLRTQTRKEFIERCEKLLLDLKTDIEMSKGGDLKLCLW